MTFGSICTVNKDTDKTYSYQRAQIRVIVGKSEELKGYRVFLKQITVVIFFVPQQIKNIETLSDAQNSHIQRGNNFKNSNDMVTLREDEATSTSSEMDALSNTCNSTQKKKTRHGRDRGRKRA